MMSFSALGATSITIQFETGTPLFVLQELGGWESTEMVPRYAHLSAEHLAPYADRLGFVNVSTEKISWHKSVTVPGMKKGCIAATL